ncbi:MAG: hypothetical protein BWY68_00703 [bacterium ADurb.Bin400]|nr:MAG: hypothetical protein BWY68_00703 [bacterium ADurb.Bin400]
MNKEILVSVTTADDVDWRGAINEVSKFGINRFALFLTGLNSEQREECYQTLSTLPNITIPFIHARTDMTLDEYELLSAHFGTELFNIHPLSDYPLIHDYTKIASHILVENAGHLTKEDIKQFGGICLDISHLENYRLSGSPRYEAVCQLLEDYPVKANHVSAITSKPYRDYDDAMKYANHTLTNLSQVDYLKNYPDRYFAPYIAIELTNNIESQLKIKEYMQKTLNLG